MCGGLGKPVGSLNSDKKKNEKKKMKIGFWTNFFLSIT